MSAMNDFANTPDALIVNGRGSDSWPICAYDYLVLNVFFPPYRSSFFFPLPLPLLIFLPFTYLHLTQLIIGKCERGKVHSNEYFGATCRMGIYNIRCTNYYHRGW
jgi:hypothetical protein